MKEKPVFLELTPPAFTEKTAYTTQQLFSVLHNLGSQRSWKERLLAQKVLFSFELVSTREEGIRYLIKTTADKADIVQRTIVSYLPHVRIKHVVDYLPKKFTLHTTKIVEFKLRKHFAYPLAKQDTLKEHDPVAYIAGMMTHLKPRELVAFQIVVAPAFPEEVLKISRMILNNENVLRYLNKQRPPWYVYMFIMLLQQSIALCEMVLRETMQTINEIFFSNPSRQRMQQYSTELQRQLSTSHIKPARVLSSFEQETVATIQEKMNQPLFETSMRAFVLLESKQGQQERIQGIKSSLAPFAVPKYQALLAKHNLPPFLMERIRGITFVHRLLSLFYNTSPSLLSVSEIADLYHFPYTTVTQTENIVKAHSKQLPAPLSLKKVHQLDVVFANNLYDGKQTDIGLTREGRKRHMYVIGASGTGKSTLMLSMINQDLAHGEGLCVIDPHGELAEAALACVPEERMKDVIYFNPDDIGYPIGVNLLEVTPGLSEDDALREKEFIAESVISLFRKIFGENLSASPHRIESMLRNAIHTALTVEGATLFTVYDLLTDPVFRAKVLKNVTDDRLQKFWKNLYGKAGGWQQVKMISPVTSRIERFLFSPSAKRILEQQKSTINFDEILDKGKILICNLSKGKISEDTSQVLGIVLLNKIQLAALKRARVPQQARKDFYLYVDEFQHFATSSFVQMLSEARKYSLNVIIAEQSTAQQQDKNLVNIILANVGTIGIFKSASPQDEDLLLPQFSPYITKGEIANLPAFHFYMKIGALAPEEPFSGTTVPVTIPKDTIQTNKIIQLSRKHYSIDYNKQQEEKVQTTKHPRTTAIKKRAITKEKPPKGGIPDEDEE